MRKELQELFLGYGGGQRNLKKQMNYDQFIHFYSP